MSHSQQVARVVMSSPAQIASAVSFAHRCGCMDCRNVLAELTDAISAEPPVDSGRASDALPRTAEGT